VCHGCRHLSDSPLTLIRVSGLMTMATVILSDIVPFKRRGLVSLGNYHFLLWQMLKAMFSVPGHEQRHGPSILSLSPWRFSSLSSSVRRRRRWWRIVGRHDRH
jgi:hypothetical protein